MRALVLGLFAASLLASAVAFISEEDINELTSVYGHEDVHRGLSMEDEPIPFGAASPECKECVKNGTKWVIEHAARRFVEKCKTTENPKFKKICEKAKQHKAVALGALIYKVRPISLAFAYCAGKGPCASPEEETDATMESSVMALDMDQLITTLEKEFNIDENEDEPEEVEDKEGCHCDCDCSNGCSCPGCHCKAEPVPYHVFTHLGEAAEAADDEGDDAHCPMMTHDELHQEYRDSMAQEDKDDCTDEEDTGVSLRRGRHRGRGPSCVCKYCVKKTAMRVMKKVVRRVVRFCEGTDKPMAKKACQAAKDHPKVAFGYLLAKVEPWKFAVGFCKGLGVCGNPFGRPPHHHHPYGTDSSENNEELAVA
ncbi:unnamed protein product [Vitrella brassicaformis CCMP3155]|uniref:Saposin B-type domain-containing protein n=2 Tax=Vitrella brassicaformis TaxID=1169539 RepID=A0A0G4ECG3_VITBC|nr:unnamed protein product [Vitrella brassicaformis CCMP3155]|eukprot:CEL93219.1 unnamed protein product [Vitrella brassicaformis CCMP3155]